MNTIHDLPAGSAQTGDPLLRAAADLCRRAGRDVGRALAFRAFRENEWLLYDEHTGEVLCSGSDLKGLLAFLRIHLGALRARLGQPRAGGEQP